MLYEATIAFLSLMLLTWGVAVWATFREQEGTETTTPSSEKGHSHRSAA